MRSQLIAQETWTRIIEGQTPGLLARAASLGLRALSVGYGLALQAHHAGYRYGIAKRTRLPALVISLGNLTVGGAGKTTASLAVSRWLLECDRRVAILSRGYGSKSERGIVVVSEGGEPLVDVATAGDEPWMAAQALPGVRVLVGKDRRRTGAHAIKELGVDALVLDDGFQYQRLEKDLDIVLIDALMPFGYNRLFPSGLLREPMKALARADAIWITHSDLVRRNDLEMIKSQIVQFAPTSRIWETVHSTVQLRRLDQQNAEAEPNAVRGRRICALSSIGNPSAFERMLEQMGAFIVSSVRFPDHHIYEKDDRRRLTEGEAASAEWIITTEKDAVRLPADFFTKPTWALQVELAGRLEGTTLTEELSCLLNAVKKA